MADREKLIELLFVGQVLADAECDKQAECNKCQYNAPNACRVGFIADHLIANGVTVQEWIPASEPPKENGYYLCVVCVSAVNQRKEYRRMILFWEDNVWIDMANCFRTKKPLYWMPMADVPQPPKGE